VCGYMQSLGRSPSRVRNTLAREVVRATKHERDRVLECVGVFSFVETRKEAIAIARPRRKNLARVETPSPQFQRRP